VQITALRFTWLFPSRTFLSSLPEAFICRRVRSCSASQYPPPPPQFVRSSTTCSLRRTFSTQLTLSVVLYGCETWSLTLREEYRLRVFEDMVLRRIFGPKWDEVAGVGENYIMRCSIICENQNCPATCHGGTWGERRYSCYSYLTSALDGGEWSAWRLGRPLPSGKGPSVPIGQEAGWASEPVWTQRLEEKSSAPVGDRTPVVQPVVRHYTAWATAAPYNLYSSLNIRLQGVPLNVDPTTTACHWHWHLLVCCLGFTCWTWLPGHVSLSNHDSMSQQQRANYQEVP
jgi:hypothetical protein